MSTPHALTFDAGELLSDEKMKHGPMTFYFLQDEWVEPGRPMERPQFQKPPRYLLARLTGRRPFYFEMRLAPPPDEDLSLWGKAVATRLSVDWASDPQEGDKAVWLPGYVMARNAGEALGSTKKVLDKLAGFKIGAMQARVVEADRAA